MTATLSMQNTINTNVIFNESRITTVESAILSHDSRLETVKSLVELNGSKIDTNESLLVTSISRIDTNESKIDTNESLLITNLSRINTSIQTQDVNRQENLTIHEINRVDNQELIKAYGDDIISRSVNIQNQNALNHRDISDTVSVMGEQILQSLKGEMTILTEGLRETMNSVRNLLQESVNNNHKDIIGLLEQHINEHHVDNEFQATKTEEIFSLLFHIETSHWSTENDGGIPTATSLINEYFGNQELLDEEGHKYGYTWQVVQDDPEFPPLLRSVPDNPDIPAIQNRRWLDYLEYVDWRELEFDDSATVDTTWEYFITEVKPILEDFKSYILWYDELPPLDLKRPHLKKEFDFYKTQIADRGFTFTQFENEIVPQYDYYLAVVVPVEPVSPAFDVFMDDYYVFMARYRDWLTYATTPTILTLVNYVPNIDPFYNGFKSWIGTTNDPQTWEFYRDNVL